MNETLAQLLAQQQVAAGMVAATLFGGLMFALKSMPEKLSRAVRELFSVTLAVEGRDPIYEHLNLWFSRHDAVGRARRMMLQQEFDYDRSDWRWKFTLGRGWHLLWTHGRPLLVQRTVTEGGELSKLLGAGVNHSMSVISIGRDQALIRRIVAEAEEIYNSDGHVRVYFWSGHNYELADRRPPRSLDTVFLPADQKARLIVDVDRFIGARDEYRARGTPYRRGYLFKGKPGTGKTSMIFALAGRLKRAVFVINLSNVHGDNALLAAFNAVGSDGVVVIEDIDTAEITKDRDLVEPQTAAAPLAAAPGGQPVSRVTLSGLLNAIDGVAAREGRILFITSNHADELDPALLRPGRIDVQEEIEPLSHETALAMFHAFCPDASQALFDRLVAARLPMVAADLQNILQEDHGGEVVDLAAARTEAVA